MGIVTSATPQNEQQVNTPLFGDEYIAPEALARELDISPRTLLRWHAERVGPPRVCVGRLVLYRRTAVREWLESREEGQPRSRRGR